jgi:hypothetical protein
LTGSFALQAQDAPDPAQNKMAKNTTVTGCVAQGAEADQYTIRETNGKTYRLMGTKVNIKPHVGHEVSVTGTSGKEDANKNTELEVDSLKMVNNACK